MSGGGYTMGVFFAGCGGDAQGSAAVPGVEIVWAGNHWDLAVESHAANFPQAEHHCGDIRELDMHDLPAWDLFWASPECKEWSQAKGVRQDWTRQPDLFGETLPDAAAERSRALMWDVPGYLEAMVLRGRPVKAGVVENVTEARKGAQWRQWVAAIENLGYKTRLIALNSMHARPVRTQYAPQSRDRLYFAYWLASLGRDPDWDKWLRPPAWCPSCEQEIPAMQAWKKPGADMGRYRFQYVFRCPRISCRGQVVEPAVLPALAAIDWSLPGQRIGDRPRTPEKPEGLAPATIARIKAGLAKYAVPVTIEAHGNTFERRPGVRSWPVTWPVTAQTTTATKGFAVPPLLTPTGGTWRDEAMPATGPAPARTTRENDGVALLPFLVPLRSGRNRSSAVTDPTATVVADGSNHGMVQLPFVTDHHGAPDEVRTRGIDQPLGALAASGNHYGVAVPPFMAILRGKSVTQPVTDPVTTLTGMGAHHALIMRNNGSRGDGSEMSTPVTEAMRALTSKGHQSLIDWRHLASHLLVPYYGNGYAASAGDPHRTMSTRDRYALASPAIDIEDVLFRMLEPHEIGAAMAFASDYVVLGKSNRVRVRQYGNAVTPPAAEVIVSALMEAITGQPYALAA